ncbi:hypothetical protein AURDEDRAFT_160197 [Auricularia subglabra TFB-10046 SS5]|nr:hypothetical protein AURDEDRAFT_160197 [Auricularia subglabra TFB-10046 SS5]
MFGKLAGAIIGDGFGAQADAFVDLGLGGSVGWGSGSGGCIGRRSDPGGPYCEERRDERTAKNGATSAENEWGAPSDTSAYEQVDGGRSAVGSDRAAAGSSGRFRITGETYCLIANIVFRDCTMIGPNIPALFASRTAAGLADLECVTVDAPVMDDDEACHVASLMHAIHEHAASGAADALTFTLKAEAGDVPGWLLQQYAYLCDGTPGHGVGAHIQKKSD